MTSDLADRLEKWIERLGQDRSLPWVGLGLVEDLKEAIAALREKEDGFYDLRAGENL